MDQGQGEPVELYIYDLSNGLAAVLSPAIIGQQVQGIWHTAVVVFGQEYFYGAGGIFNCAPGSTALGAPHQVERLGETFVPYPVFRDYLHGLSTTNYSGAEYRLLEHNCNSFTEEVAQFLCGAHIPKRVSEQTRALPPALTRALSALLAGLRPAQSATGERRDSLDYDALNHQVDEARVQSRELEQRRSTLAEKLARKDKKKEKKRKKERRAAGDAADNDEMAEVEAASAPAGEARAGPSAAPEPDERELRLALNPPILYTDIDALEELEQLSGALSGAALSGDEQQSVDELRQYAAGEGSWVLGDDFLATVERLLSDGSASGARVPLLRVLCALARRDDVALLLHQDRRRHALLAHAASIEARDLPEQRAIALFMVNLFANVSSSEWLLYISEWEYNGQPYSNIRATTKVCVTAVLSPDEELAAAGTALLYNIACKEVKTVVFDEVCVELGMAALQLLSLQPGEEAAWRALAALTRLARACRDLPPLVLMVGPDPAAFRGMSPRIDEQIDAISKLLK